MLPFDGTDIEGDTLDGGTLGGGTLCGGALCRGTLDGGTKDGGTLNGKTLDRGILGVPPYAAGLGSTVTSFDWLPADFFLFRFLVFGS